MGTESTRNPNTLYGPVSLVFGIVSVVTTVLGDFVGSGISVVAGSLAVTFAIFGLVNRVRRVLCVIGLVSGAASVLCFLWLIVALGMTG